MNSIKKPILTLFLLLGFTLLNAQVSNSKYYATDSSSVNKSMIPSCQNQQKPIEPDSKSIRNIPESEQLKTSQNYESFRPQLEKQMQIEKDKYRNDFFFRIISNEYIQLTNNKTPEANVSQQIGISKLAKYKLLKDILLEQQNLQRKSSSANTNISNQPQENLQRYNQLLQQLDQKIREEEQHFEMINNQRKEKERNLPKNNQNGTTN